MNYLNDTKIWVADQRTPAFYPLIIKKSGVFVDIHKNFMGI